MLRDAGLSVSLSETLDAVRAVRVVGIARRDLHDGLAASLLKDEANRQAFEAIFDRCFPLVGVRRGKVRRVPRGDAGSGAATAKAGRQSRPLPTKAIQDPDRSDQPSEEQRPAHTFLRQDGERDGLSSRNRRLWDVRFEDMSPSDIEECDALVAALAQRLRASLRRRQRAARRGRLDIRRTIRRSISSGGVPIEPAFRRRQPRNPDLIALCDCSHSVATAARFLIGLLSPAQEFFRRVRLFAYVDRPIESTIESAMLVPHEPLDLYARSDFGRVLLTFWERHDRIPTRNTIVLILGDARNNRRPPRADLLARLRGVVRHVVWLNPESTARWNSGDSVIQTYQRHCDVVLAASTVRELYIALRRGLTMT